MPILERVTALNPIEIAILKTVLYADVFNFPLKPHELHHFLIADQLISLEQVNHTLDSSPRLAALLERIDDYIVCIGRREIIEVRQQRERASQVLWDKAIHYGKWLARLPFVRMVAITGALSMRNANSDDDDLDYVLVTAARRVWIARGFAVLLVKLARRQGVEVCPNYVLAETALEQEKQDLFIAHEVIQMVPLYGFAHYTRMRDVNAWVLNDLPNTTTPFYALSEAKISGAWSLFKRGTEWVLSGVLGDMLDNWERRRKVRRFAPQLQTPNHAAQLDEQRVKGHFNDHGHPALNGYYERLRRYHLDEIETPLPLAGD